MNASLEIETFPRLTTWIITSTDKHGLLIKLLKLKPLVFKGIEFEDTNDFLIYYHELHHKMDIVE